MTSTHLDLLCCACCRADYGYEEPTLVQQLCLPPVLSGRDAVIHAKSIAGKSAALCISALNRIDISILQCQAVIVAPNAELASATARLISEFGHCLVGLRVHVACGGRPVKSTIAALANGVHIVVGTLGRISDLIARDILRVRPLRLMAFDEIDHMFGRGFEESIREICQTLSQETQVRPTAYCILRCHVV